MNYAGFSLRAALLRSAPVLLPVLLLAVMLVVNPALRQPVVWDRMSRNWTGEILLAIALTPIIITGGIDLSVGSVVGLSAVAGGFLWRVCGLPVPVALTGCLLAGLLCGTVNGALVLTGINPLVVTLATLAIFRGLAYGTSGVQPVQDLPVDLAWWESDFLGLPRPLWLAAGVFGLYYVFLHHTWMGRMLYAIGDNRRAARYAAVPIRTLTFALYAACGLVAGLVGLTTVLQTGAAPAQQGEGIELTAITCVVLGGIRITGGAGHLAGTFLGTTTLIILLEGVQRVRGEWRTLATGAFLIAVAVANEGLARLRVRGEAAR
jgi:rhamnose transport system permease protein